jgi:hypothetical protein
LKRKAHWNCEANDIGARPNRRPAGSASSAPPAMAASPLANSGAAAATSIGVREIALISSAGKRTK